MATALIPEVIQPGALYSPSIYNQFSISSGTLPNTDDALFIAATAGRFQAYQPAISGIHYKAVDTDSISVLFWLYHNDPSTAVSSTGTLRSTEIIMIVHDATQLSSNDTTTEPTVGFRWGISMASVNMRSLNFQYAVGASSRASATMGNNNVVALNFVGGTWHGAAFRYGAVGASPSIYDFALNSKTAGVGAGTAGTPGALSSPYFSLGPFAVSTGWDSYDASDFNLTKIAIFNRLVTDAELLDLLDSMNNGPPSP